MSIFDKSEWSDRELRYLNEEINVFLMTMIWIVFVVAILIGGIITKLGLLPPVLAVALALGLASYPVLGFIVITSRTNLSGRWLGHLTAPGWLPQRIALTLLALPALITFGLVAAMTLLPKQIWLGAQQALLNRRHRLKVAEAHKEILKLPNGEEVLEAYKLWQKLEDLEAPIDELDRAEALYRRLAEKGQRQLPAPADPVHEREARIQRLIGEVERLEGIETASKQIDRQLLEARLQSKERTTQD